MVEWCIGDINFSLFFINQFLNRVDSLSSEEFSKTDERVQLIYPNLKEILAVIQALCTLSTDDKAYIGRDYLDEKLGRLHIASNNLDQLYNFVKEEENEN